MGKRWYVGRTQPGLGALAEAELSKPFLSRPAFRCLRVTDRGKSVFGPYIFIEFDEDNDPWWMVNGVRGMVRLLPVNTPYPLPLRASFIDDLRERMAVGGFGPQEVEGFMHKWSVGEPALVTSGPWIGHQAPFVRKQKGFVNLSMVLFGRAFELPIPAHQVQPASPVMA